MYGRPCAAATPTRPVWSERLFEAPCIHGIDRCRRRPESAGWRRAHLKRGLSTRGPSECCETFSFRSLRPLGTGAAAGHRSREKGVCGPAECPDLAEKLFKQTTDRAEHAEGFSRVHGACRLHRRWASHAATLRNTGSPPMRCSNAWKGRPSSRSSGPARPFSVSTAAFFPLCPFCAVGGP